MTGGPQISASPVGSLARVVVGLFASIFVVANLGVVELNFVAVRFPIPLAVLILLVATAAWFGALRWNVMRVEAERERRRRRREMDALLGRRQERAGAR